MNGSLLLFITSLSGNEETMSQIDSSQPQQPPKYAPQQPMYQQPFQPQPQKKKSRKGLWIIIGVVVLIIAIISTAVGGHSGSQPVTSSTSSTSSGSQQQLTQAANQPTSQPTQPQATQTWTTTQTFTGNGIKKTQIFTVPNDWKIIWTCDPTSFSDIQFNLIVTVTDSSATPIDLAVNTLCKPGNTSGETEEHQGGQVYLDVNSEGSWTLKVQELK
jgi:hypothetical protein